MFNLEKAVRQNIKSLNPYSCARDDYKGENGIFLDANENPFGTLNRYPDPYQSKLKSAISRIKGVPEENIFLGNGSDEIIDLCFRIFCCPGEDKVLTFIPSYGMYKVSAAINDVRIIGVPLDDSFNISLSKTELWFQDHTIKIVIICSPNNPTGNCMKRDAIEKIISAFNGIVLLDEAYNDFSDEPSLRYSLDKFPNLIVMQTLSKAWGMASVRIGMAFASKGIIGYFNKIKPPYNISSVNQNAALERISNPSKFRQEVFKIRTERERLVSELKKLSFITGVFPSDANFILVKVSDAELIYNYLAGNGIIVRNRSSDINNCLRITVGTKAENTAIIRSLAGIKL